MLTRFLGTGNLSHKEVVSDAIICHHNRMFWGNGINSNNDLQFQEEDLEYSHYLVAFVFFKMWCMYLCSQWTSGLGCST